MNIYLVKTLMDKHTKIFYSGKIMVIVILVVYLLTGCITPRTSTLMPTPVIYQDSSIDPFAHLTSTQKSTKTQVFYATNRVPKFSKDELFYSNKLDSNIHLGKATIHIGNPDSSWDDLYEYSLSSKHIKPLPIVLEKTVEMAVMPSNVDNSNSNLTPEQQVFIDSINAELAKAVDKEIMVYVHGTKVDFAHSTILTAEIDHFAGRDYVGLAFAWPSHQKLWYYLFGIDVHRALNSSSALQSLLVLLSEHTIAEHINILAWSAGGKVTTKALFEMRQTYSELDSKELRDKFRIGAVVLAAIDVEIDVFLERLPFISEFVDQLVITVTDNDNALKVAKLSMGGTDRAGSTKSEIIEENFIISHHLTNVEIIDVSMGQKIRGFDIEGHYYWFRHPWMSSDIIFLMRTNLPPHRRGLSSAELEGIWYLSPDYPKKIRKAAEIELKGQW